MQIESKIIGIINDKLKNPIYETLRLLNMKTILTKSNFSKKEGVAVHMVVLHFVYMLVMNKKISTFMDQSNDSFKKDVYYRLLANAHYNWRKLLSLSSLKILSLLHKVQDAKLVRVLILDDTVEDKVGKNIEGSCDNLWSNKAKRKIRGVNVVSLNYSDGYSNFMLDFAIAMNNYARVKIEEFTNIIDHRTNAHKRRLESLKGKSQIAIEMIKRAVASGIYADYLLVDSWYSKPVFIETMNELGLQVISTMKDYFSIAFKYAFNFIVAEGELNDQTIILINDNITHNQNLTIKTQKKYKRIVNFFLRSFTQYNTLEKINIAMDVRRTIVFQEEINEFVNLIIKEDKVKFQLTKNIKIKSNIRAVFILLLYYSGLRKTELRTRMLNDIYMLDEETFVIDVNSKGFRETMKSTGETELKLKTSNARRRVKFKISDRNHLHIVKSYLRFLEERQFKFLFPAFSSQSHNLLKKHVINDSFIADLSKVLQSVTNRYTPLHSLRHTFATNYFINNINKSEQHIIYELANLIGHSDPSVTINNYLHLDFLSFNSSCDY